MTDKQTISGEEHHAALQASSHSGKQVTIKTQQVKLVVASVLLCAAGFWAGVTYQRHRTPVMTAAFSNSGFGGRAFGGARRGGGIGAVTAVSTTSISISDMRSNTTQTFAINSSTAITDNGQSMQASDIKTGDTVFVMTSGSGSTTATRIDVNPSFGGGFGGSSAPMGVSSGTTSQTTN